MVVLMYLSGLQKTKSFAYPVFFNLGQSQVLNRKNISHNVYYGKLFAMFFEKKLIEYSLFRFKQPTEEEEK